MRFDPQANMVSGASGQSGKNAPKGGLRAGMLIVIVAMAGAFGTWIYKQVDLGPSRASAAASNPTADFSRPSIAPNTSRIGPAQGTARRSDMHAESARRTSDTPSDHASSGTSGENGRNAVVVKDSKRRFATAAYAEGDKALSAGRHAEAIMAFNKAIELDPGYADAYYARGLAYIMAGDRRMAIEQLRRLREMDGNLANLLANLLE